MRVRNIRHKGNEKEEAVNAFCIAVGQLIHLMNFRKFQFSIKHIVLRLVGYIRFGIFAYIFLFLFISAGLENRVFRTAYGMYTIAKLRNYIA